MAKLKVFTAAALFSLAGSIPAWPQAAVQEPGLASFYHPDRDPLQGRYSGPYGYGSGYGPAYSANAAYLDDGPVVQVRPVTRNQHHVRTPQR